MFVKKKMVACTSTTTSGDSPKGIHGGNRTFHIPVMRAEPSTDSSTLIVTTKTTISRLEEWRYQTKYEFRVKGVCLIQLNTSNWKQSLHETDRSAFKFSDRSCRRPPVCKIYRGWQLCSVLFWVSLFLMLERWPLSRHLYWLERTRS